MLPLVFFETVYKLLWLATVALTLWSANQMGGSRAEELTYMPWPYVFRRYIWNPFLHR